MKLVAAYLLAQLGGNASPSAKDVQKILSSVGVECDQDRLKVLISELKDKSVEEVWLSQAWRLCSGIWSVVDAVDVVWCWIVLGCLGWGG
jgi:large subunit ribosomal protein LP2